MSPITEQASRGLEEEAQGDEDHQGQKGGSPHHRLQVFFPGPVKGQSQNHRQSVQDPVRRVHVGLLVRTPGWRDRPISPPLGPGGRPGVEPGGVRIGAPRPPCQTVSTSGQYKPGRRPLARPLARGLARGPPAPPSLALARPSLPVPWSGPGPCPWAPMACPGGGTDGRPLSVDHWTTLDHGRGPLGPGVLPWERPPWTTGPRSTANT